jgi:hypothetical protein
MRAREGEGEGKKERGGLREGKRERGRGRGGEISPEIRVSAEAAPPPRARRAPSSGHPPQPRDKSRFVYCFRFTLSVLINARGLYSAAIGISGSGPRGGCRRWRRYAHDAADSLDPSCLAASANAWPPTAAAAAPSRGWRAAAAPAGRPLRLDGYKYPHLRTRRHHHRRERERERKREREREREEVPLPPRPLDKKMKPSDEEENPAAYATAITPLIVCNSSLKL